MFALQRFARNLGAAHLMRRTSSSVTVTAKTSAPIEQPSDPSQKKIRSKTLVEAAFESLKEQETSDTTHEEKKDKNVIDEKIINAKTVNGLLSLSEANQSISRKHALKIVSILAEWSSINRVKLSDFENDSRFLKICRVLGRTVPKNNNSNNDNSKRNGKDVPGFRTDDLNTVLGIAGDDEAAKLIASISLPQMVKVMSNLALRKRRSTPLLRSLAFNISANTEHLDLKQCGDILYAMSTLNFPDSVLSAKVCGDIQGGLSKNVDKSAAVGSILTSLGILKYRDLDVLESLIDWMLKNSEITRPQDLSSLFLTLGILNYKSPNLDEINNKLGYLLVKEDFTKPNDWLNHVWALTMLRIVKQQQIESVLSEEFIKLLEKDKNGLTPNSKMKLLNINAYGKLMISKYTGSLLKPDSVIYSVPLAHNKSKQILLNGMIDALKSLLSSQNLLRTEIDTKMGFLIDAECQFDGKRNPMPIDQVNPNGKRVALMIVDFHDMCHGANRSLSGISNLSFDLLEKSGYDVLPISYIEFNNSDKLLKRVQYLEARFKEIVHKQNRTN